MFFIHIFFFFNFLCVSTTQIPRWYLLLNDGIMWTCTSSIMLTDTDCGLAVCLGDKTKYFALETENYCESPVLIEVFLTYTTRPPDIGDPISKFIASNKMKWNKNKNWTAKKKHRRQRWLGQIHSKHSSITIPFIVSGYIFFSLLLLSGRVLISSFMLRNFSSNK